MIRVAEPDPHYFWSWIRILQQWSEAVKYRCRHHLWLGWRIRMNQHYFRKLDPDLCKSEQLNADPHLSQNLKALMAQNRAVERHVRSQWRLKMEPWRRVYRLPSLCRGAGSGSAFKWKAGSEYGYALKWKAGSKSAWIENLYPDPY